MTMVKSFFILVFLTLTLSGAGGQVVNFRLNDLNNRPRSFSELRGDKLTLIDFWATWCRPCLRAIPELNRIHEIYGDRGVNIIGVNCDGPRSISKVLPLTRSLQVSYPVVTDMNADLMKSLNLSAFPTLLLADREGKVLWVHEGFIPGDEELIKREIERYLERYN